MNRYTLRGAAVCLAAVLISGSVIAQTARDTIQERNVRAQMGFLASDAMKGRGSGSDEERIAGEYFGSMMRQFGIEPGGDTAADGTRSYVQTVEIRRQSFAAPPTLTYKSGDAATVLTHGEEMVVIRIGSGSVKGPLKKLAKGEAPVPGTVSLIRYDASDEGSFNARIGALMSSGATAVLIEETSQLRENWDRFGGRPVSLPQGRSARGAQTALIAVSKAAAEALAAAADGTEIEIGGKVAEQVSYTWNSVGFIKGADPKLSSEVILLSAHMDHLGVRPNAPGDDKIFNGADDDASGCVAVIELARVLAAGKTPKRTVYFVFFGSEESGGYGARYFIDNLPFPKDKLVANLQWEMLGRPDPKVAADELWLTGFTMSNLGPELAKHGAKLVNDPHPEQNFFQRSDNYTLARQGVVAHTVSSYGLHTDYHHASDEISTIDFEHMTKAINSMVEPVRWLLNSDFKPSWYEGKDPSQ